MRTLLFIITSLLCGVSALGQAIYQNYPSDILGTERNVKILKPRNYSTNTEKAYPLIIVLDGDYLFEPVAGMVDYLSYWDQMPESLVIGINQRETRWEETAINPNNGLPDEKAGKFMAFLMEIKATMEKEFRVAPFTVIIGKDLTANLAGYYLMRKKLEIDALLQIDPEYSELMQNNLVTRLANVDEHHFFYVATTEENQDPHKMFNAEANTLFDMNEKVLVKHDQLDHANKYSIAGPAIPNGLDFIFKGYQLINPKELVDQDLAEERRFDEAGGVGEKERAIDRVKIKYEYIKEVYGIDVKVRLIDLVTVAEHVIGKEDWDQLIDIGDMAHDEYPELLYGRYLEGLGYHGIGRTRRAIKSFNAAYALEPTVGITKTDVLDKIELIQLEEEKEEREENKEKEEEEGNEDKY